jgi:peptidoglycan/LPS O-acetylase OafA/YrhL
MSVDFKAPQIKQKIKGLDGLRGLSVLLVIFSHAEIWPKIGLENSRVLAVLSAHVGVSVFFALSGFLITLLLLQERSSTGSVSLRNSFFPAHPENIPTVLFVANYTLPN